MDRILTDKSVPVVARMRSVSQKADEIFQMAQKRDRERPPPDSLIKDNKTRQDVIQHEFEKVDDVNNMLLEAIKTKLAILDH